MKVLLIALLSLAPALSFASDASEASGGTYAPVSGHIGCKEGKTEIFNEYDYSSDSVVRVARTCRNGAFAVTPKVSHKSCKEGAQEIITVFNASSDSQERVVVTCHNGVWM